MTGQTTPHLIAITGKSGAGKTALSDMVKKRLVNRFPLIFSLDGYYVDLSHLPFETRQIQNFDLPEALDWNLLIEHLDSLKQGLDIARPVYDFGTHTRRPESEYIQSREIIIVEGLFACHERLRNFVDFGVFIEIDDHTALSRRIKRDTLERGRSRESVISQFHNQVLPAFPIHVEPTKDYADLVLNGSKPLEISTNLLLASLARHYPLLFP